jgi:hypothetical protein
MGSQNTSSLLVAAFLLSACGSSFAVKAPVQVASSTAGDSTATAGTAPGTANNSDSKIVTSEGELTWTTQASATKDLQYSFDLKIPFGRVFKIASKVTHLSAPLACQWTDGISSGAPWDFNEGEIPCGEIIDKQWKRLITVDIDPYTGSSDGFQVSVSGAHIPILLSRTANQGMYDEPNLDTKTISSRPSSKDFAEDISVRYIPDDKSARLELCLNVPGVTITAPTQIVHAKASKSVLGVKLGYSSDLNVTPGSSSFDYARGCFAADFGWHDQSLDPSVAFSATQAPYLSHVAYTGLNIRIDDWFLRLMDRILSTFNVTLRKNLIAQLTKTANDYADKDIETGKWFAKFGGEQVLKSTGERMTQNLSHVLTRIGVPSTTSELRQILHDNCRIKKLSGSAWNARFETLCSEVIDSVNVTLAPFKIDVKSKAAGCYESFARIHDTSDSSGQAKWWASQCKFATGFSITLPAKWNDFDIELKQIVGDTISPSRIPADWSIHLSDAGVDDFLLSLLLEELEKRGYTQLSPSDWTQEIPAILAELKQQL